MITEVWIKPDDPDLDETVVLRYDDTDTTWMFDGDGNRWPILDWNSAGWTQTWPVSGVHNSVSGSVTGTLVQGRDMGPITFS